MASEQGDEQNRRPPPLGLRGLSRAAFLPRSGDATRHAGGLPPLGLAGRALLPSFSIGTAGSEPVSRSRAGAVRRIGLSRPSRPPPPNHAGSSNWSSSPGGSGSGSASGGNGSSSYVGLNVLNGGGISFGGMGSGGAIRIGEISSVFSGFSGNTGNAHGGVGGEGSGESGGYRGKGYNPNFENADEYPPSQEHLQAPPHKEIDLSKSKLG